MPFVKGMTFTEEHRAKLSRANSKPRPWKVGFKHSEETKRKIGLASKGNTFRRGKTLTEETKRKISETLRKNIGSPYVSSSGKIYHPDWRLIRKRVYKRDNWTCQECEVHCHGLVIIQCHHIDYDVSNNNMLNLITLCNSCHSKTNYNREYWIEHFKQRSILWVKG